MKRELNEPTEFQNASRAIELVIEEYGRATNMNGPFASAHEGYAVILEELDELWEEVKKNPAKRDPEKMLKEAVQVAAMGLRFVVDVCLIESVASEEVQAG